MIILNKKKILTILGIAIIFVFIYTITGFNLNNSSKNNTKTIATVALPVDNKVIIIDAGHGIPDEGAESSKRYN
ncbi:MAG: hypothetical protein Q4G09_02525 [Clostridia bacterium]|nr:hypothetical protein [Clostridia bacterium]